MTDLTDGTVTVLIGDVRERLAELPAGSVHCVVTSPPYWGLRDYGVGGQLGLEPTPEEYVENMVAVFREVRRVLRADGTVWMNLGDSYNANQGAGFNGQKRQDHANRHTVMPRPDWLKPKDLVGIPWRVAFALQADGWYLRSDIVWSKPNPMPESVSDRPTKAHEYLFLLTKAPRYFYDADAIRETTGTEVSWEEWGRANGRHAPSGNLTQGVNAGFGSKAESFTHPSGRNKRSVWEIATEPYPEAHFATFPQALVEPCVKAGTSERGCCPECGAPWVREVERDSGQPQRANLAAAREGVYGSHRVDESRAGGFYPQTVTTGWAPSCAHKVGASGATGASSAKPGDPALAPIPCTVLDPFAGSGTTLLVARKLGRRAIGVELSPEYAALIPRRFGSLWGQLDLLTQGVA